MSPLKIENVTCFVAQLNIIMAMNRVCHHLLKCHDTWYWAQC